jgi:hypothetical protein
VVLLKELSVALLNALDEAVLGLHLVGVLLKQGAHVLGIACRERPTGVVSQTLGVTNDGHTLTPHRIALIPNGEQGDGSAVEAQQVVLTELHEGLVGSPL